MSKVWAECPNLGHTTLLRFELKSPPKDTTRPDIYGRVVPINLVKSDTIVYISVYNSAYWTIRVLQGTKV